MKPKLTEQEVNISPSLTLTEVWTNEKTPKLKSVKVTHWHGISGITSEIDAIDLSQTIIVLKRIEQDMKIQERVKKRATK